MSGFYEVWGTVKVLTDSQTREVVKEIVERFNDESYEDLSAIYDPEAGEVKFNGGFQCGYVRSSLLEGVIKELSPFVAEPVELDSQYDGESSKLYVGPTGMQQATASKNVLEEIKDVLQYLLPEDVAKLKEML